MIYRVILLAFLFYSCNRHVELSDRFMNECDCFVYEDDIIKQHKKGYTIERINLQAASSCVRKQLKHTCIIYFTDSIGSKQLVIESKKPDKLIRQTKQLSLHYGHSPYRLTHVYEIRNNELKLIVGKQYHNNQDTVFNGSYMPFKEVILKRKKTEWIEESIEINPSWPWKTPSNVNGKE